MWIKYWREIRKSLNWTTEQVSLDVSVCSLHFISELRRWEDFVLSVNNEVVLLRLALVERGNRNDGVH